MQGHFEITQGLGFREFGARSQLSTLKGVQGHDEAPGWD